MRCISFATQRIYLHLFINRGDVPFRFCAADRRCDAMTDDAKKRKRKDSSQPESADVIITSSSSKKDIYPTCMSCNCNDTWLRRHQSNYVSQIALQALLPSSKAGIDRGVNPCGCIRILHCLSVSFNVLCQFLLLQRSWCGSISIVHATTL